MSKAKPKLLVPVSSVRRAYVYLVGYSGDRVKIGYSGNIRQRLNTHRKMAGEAFAWCHVFAGHPNSSAAYIERRSIAALSKVCERIGATEHFRGIGKAAAIECVRATIAKCEADQASADKWFKRYLRNLREDAARRTAA